MRSLALFLLLLNIGFLSWQLSKLPWLPWQPEQFIQPASQPREPISNLPRLVLWHERHLPNTIQSENTNQSAVSTDSIETESQIANTSFPSDKSASTFETPVEKVIGITDNTITKPTTVSTTDTKITNLLTEANITRENQSAKTGEENADTKIVGENSLVVTNQKNTDAHKISLSKSQPTTKQPTISPKKLEVENKKLEVENKSNNEMVNQASSPAVSKLTDVSKSNLRKTSNSFACFQLGPYLQAKSTEEIANWLKRTENIIVSRQNRQTPVLDSTWVYLPPFKDRQAAQSALQRLEQLAIKKDYAIVKSGKFNNAISLGLYRNRFYVKQRLEELSAKGYSNVKTQKRYKNDTRYWLNVKMPADQKKLLNTFRKKVKKSMLASVACESIANNAKIP